MSRIGKLPVNLPEKVEVKIEANKVSVKGPKGKLDFALPKGVKVLIDGKTVLVERENDERLAKSLHGLCRSQVANMVKGVSEGFSRDLEINGVGYRAEMKGTEIHLALGFSHPVVFPLPTGVSGIVDAKKTRITLNGIDKQELGNIAAKIRAFRPPEPYKGKGIKYAEEVIKRKEGKSAGK